MQISLERIKRDFLALLGESPRLSPFLDNDEDSAVLTLEDKLTVMLEACAIKATLETDTLYLDEVEETYPEIQWSANGSGKLYLPADYLKLVSIRMPDWGESVTEPETKGTLRDSLRGNAPEWLNCHERPLVVEGRDRKGRFLKIYGSAPIYDEPEELQYVTLPKLEDNKLNISGAAYPRMLELLIDYAGKDS